MSVPVSKTVLRDRKSNLKSRWVVWRKDHCAEKITGQKETTSKVDKPLMAKVTESGQ